MFKKRLLSFLLIFVLSISFTACSSSGGVSTPDECINISADFKSMFDKSLERTGFNEKDIVSVSYQSPEYVKYYLDVASQYMDDAASLPVDDESDSIMSIGTYYGKAMNVVFNSDKKITKSTDIAYDSIDEKFIPKYTALNALNAALDYSGIKCSDISILQMIIDGSTWVVSIAIDDSNSDNGFFWYDDIVVRSDTCEIVTVSESTADIQK